jgi:molybdopterin molybdotransferase
MLSLDDARALLQTRVRSLLPVEVCLAQGLGCHLAVAPRADTDLPPSDLAAMDGYAARAAELAAGMHLRIAFVVPAGAAPEPLPVGSVARIFTGAMVPPGADIVVPQEQAELLADGRVLPWKGSQEVLAAASANALAHLDRQGEVAAGTRVACFPLPWRWAD